MITNIWHDYFCEHALYCGSTKKTLRECKVFFVNKLTNGRLLTTSRYISHPVLLMHGRGDKRVPRKPTTHGKRSGEPNATQGHEWFNRFMFCLTKRPF